MRVMTLLLPGEHTILDKWIIKLINCDILVMVRVNQESYRRI
jgi:hypothetical protein